MDCEHQESQQRCRVDHFRTQEDFKLEDMAGDWYPRYALRHDAPYFESAHVNFEKLEDGNVKTYATGAK